MAIVPSEAHNSIESESRLLLMSQQETGVHHEYVIDVPNDINSSSISGREHHQDYDGLNNDDHVAIVHAPLSRSTSITNSFSSSRNTSGLRRGDSPTRHTSLLNSVLWISIEFIVNLSQIVAALAVLILSRNERPKAPLFAWVIGYTVGCFASLPHLLWRYIYRNHLDSEDELEQSNRNPSRSSLTDGDAYTDVPSAQAFGDNGLNEPAVTQNTITVNPRIRAIVDHLKILLDCFFAVWFVVGNVWIFGGHASAADAPNLYRLCIAFLTFSCIGYAMPFILCAMICCCLPCIISVMGIREDQNQNRGASLESINALPVYKFEAKKPSIGEEAQGDVIVGILASETDTERTISAEDAICCICLSKYVDDDELRELPCAHYFHKECIDRWLKINALCPLCKVEVGSLSCSSDLTIGRHRRVAADVDSESGQ